MGMTEDMRYEAPYDPCADGHTPIAGMMHVHAEDLNTVTMERWARGIAPVECEQCDMVHMYARGWVMS